MKKVILLTTVLGLGALGMACGEAANNTNTKPNTNVAPANSPAPIASPANTAPAGNTTNSNMKPGNTAANNSAMKPAVTANNANKK